MKIFAQAHLPICKAPIVRSSENSLKQFQARKSSSFKQAECWVVQKLLLSEENIQNFVGFYLHQLFDSAHYFLSDVERLCCPEYEPSDQDVLRTRVATTGIVKVEFEYRHLTFNLLDVGGQVWPLVPNRFPITTFKRHK